MTILAFWEVGYPGDNQPERDAFDNCSHEDAFKQLWENRDKWGVKLYDIETVKLHDIETNEKDNPRGIQALLDGYDFQSDYNDELLDGGYWTLVLHLRSDYVKQIIGE